jgi:hypothetical protein
VKTRRVDEQPLRFPPSTGTTHVSCVAPPRVMSTPMYAMRIPSGENAGLILSSMSLVSCTGSPSGSSFTYTWPGPANVLGPRMNASIRPSGDSVGETAESAKLVSCV